MQPTVPNVLLSFAQTIGAYVEGNKLIIPEKLGRGYCTGYLFNDHVRMLISDYELNEDVIVGNTDLNTAKRMIFFKFQNIFPKNISPTAQTQVENMPSVLIGTSFINTATEVSIHTNTSTINIEVDAAYLSGIFSTESRSPIIQSLLQNTQPLLFEQMIDPSLRQIVEEILTENIEETFKLFFLRIKSEELICRLLIALDKRGEQKLYPLNNADIQRLYQVRDRMLSQLDVPPAIKDLAEEAGMSPTKLKLMFKQIFGDSIFSYYQHFRMKEAARLLSDEHSSVTEAGYRMGFTNLSHFTRVFEQHLGIKPKRYSLTK